MKKNKRSLTTARARTGRTATAGIAKRKRYETRARQERKQAREGLYLRKRARVNLAENIARLLNSSAGNTELRLKINAAAILARLERAWSIGASDPEAAISAGISVKQVNEIRQQLPELAERAELLKQCPTLTARTTIVKNLKKPRWSAWYLERKAPAEFAQQNKVEHSGEMLFSHFAGKQGSYDKRAPGIENKEKDDK